nr:hypothetical protein [uncultured bacterium]
MTRRTTFALRPQMVPVAPRTKVRAGLAGLVLGCLVLGGCDAGSEDLSARIEGLRIRVEAMHASGGAPAPAEQRQKLYTALVAETGQLMERGSEAQKAVLALIRAQANGGLADIEAQRVHEIIGGVTGQIMSVRAALDLYASHNALADSMLGYSPAEDFSRLEDQSAMLQQRMEEVRRALEANDAELASLVAEAEELQAQAQHELDEAARLDIEALSSGGADRSGLIEQKTQHRLQAAEFERLHALKQIDIGRVEPVSEGARQEIARLQRQLDRVASARATVRDMDRALTKQSETARKSATDVANEIASRAEALRALVEDSFDPAYQSAMSKYASASSDVGKARSAGDREAVALLQASLASSSALLAQSRADIMSNLANLMGELAQAKPALPGREKFAERQRRCADLAGEARSAFEGFAQQASSSMRGSGARGPAGEVLTGVADWYEGQSGAGRGDDGDAAEEPAFDDGASDEPESQPEMAGDAPERE